MVDNRVEFVEWANSVNVEAVFSGHTHSTGGYKEIYLSDINREDYNLNTDGATLDFSKMTFYIETESSS